MSIRYDTLIPFYQKLNYKCAKGTKNPDTNECEDNEELINNNTIILNTHPLNITQTETYKEVYTNMPIKSDDKNNDEFYDYLHDQQDSIFYKLIKEVKFDKLPTIVSKHEMDNLILDNNIELFRGVSNKKYSDQFKYEEYIIGNGVLGKGTYTTIDNNMAKQYSTKKDTGTIIKMALSKNAKIIDYSDLITTQSNIIKPFKDQLEKSDKLNYNRNSKIYRIVDTMTKDTSTLAIINGYDAIRKGDIILVLNRKALYIQED